MPSSWPPASRHRGIAASAQKAGIYNGEVALTEPMLCQLLDDMATGYETMGRAAAHQQGLEHGLQAAFQQAARATIPPMPVEQQIRWWFDMSYRMAARSVLAGEVVSDTRSPADYALDMGSIWPRVPLRCWKPLTKRTGPAG